MAGETGASGRLSVSAAVSGTWTEMAGSPFGTSINNSVHQASTLRHRGDVNHAGWLVRVVCVVTAPTMTDLTGSDATVVGTGTGSIYVLTCALE